MWLRFLRARASCPSNPSIWGLSLVTVSDCRLFHSPLASLSSLFGSRSNCPFVFSADCREIFVIMTFHCRASWRFEFQWILTFLWVFDDFVTCGKFVLTVFYRARIVFWCLPLNVGKFCHNDVSLPGNLAFWISVKSSHPVGERKSVTNWFLCSFPVSELKLHH